MATKPLETSARVKGRMMRARAYATEGEIRGAMREVSGDHTEPAEV